MTVIRKSSKAAWFLVIAMLGNLRPSAASRLAIRFYRRRGMNFEGDPTFVSSRAWFDSSCNYSLITLSAGCNVSQDVRVLTHDWSPYCVLASLGRAQTTPIGRLQPVHIGAHAFIGLGAIVMPGATIGRGAVVGAGAVVRGDVPDYAIVIGNPAAIIGDARDYVARKFPAAWRQLPDWSSPSGND